MKRIITAASAAAAALVVMVALSAASASADTVVCQTATTPCPYSSIKPAGSYVVTGNSGNYLAFRIGTQFECSSNSLIAESKAVTGNPLAAALHPSLSGCRQSGKIGCNGSMNEPATTLEATTTGGLMKIGSAAEPLTFTFVCEPESPAPWTCTYKAKDTVSLDVQQKTAKALAVPVVRTSGETCYPSDYLWIENITEGRFISKYTPSGTVICKTAEEPCGESNHYGSGTSLTATPETKATFNNPVFKTECTSSSLAGQLTGAGGVGKNVPAEITSISFSGCSNSATVTVEGLPWQATIFHGATLGNGSLYMTGVKVKFYRFGMTCYYGGNMSATIHNSELSFNASSMQVLEGSGALCGSLGTGSGSWSGSYGVTAPGPLYVTWM